MNLQDRILTLADLGKILADPTNGTGAVAEKAHRENGWFVPQFIELATQNIVQGMLQSHDLEEVAAQYQLSEPAAPKQVGVVMAGNIPLVGFHDLLMVLLSGHKAIVKYSSKDKVLMEFVIHQLISLNPQMEQRIEVREQLKACDAYIATGSNNTGRYFAYYFGRYPNIIRQNRTSAAVLDGTETKAELEALAADMLDYFGLGCRNISALRVPEGYAWEPLLAALHRYLWMKDHNKFRNNYDYQLSLHILNNQYYMTDGNLLLVEHASIFAPISTVHYQYYNGAFDAADFAAREATKLQCLVGHEIGLPFGATQKPGLRDFADGVDTLSFLRDL